MESTVLAAIVGASSAVATNIIVSFVNTRGAKKARAHELEKETQRARFDFLKSQSEKSRQHYERAHVLLSILQREFSLTSLSIDWGDNLPHASGMESIGSFAGRLMSSG